MLSVAKSRSAGPSKLKIYTKTGDKGLTSLYGGKRVSKDNLRVCAYGAVDELNSAIGIVISFLKIKKVTNILLEVQADLFAIGAHLAGSNQNLEKLKDRVMEMENLIDLLDQELTELKNFILPSGSKAASFAQLARSINRRAEREVIRLAKTESLLNPQVLIYLNRFSDLLFVIARYINKKEGKKDVIWKATS